MTTTDPLLEAELTEDEAAKATTSPIRLLVRRFLSRKLAVAGLAMLVVLGLLAIFAPWIAPHDPTQGDSARLLEGPSRDHWLGTDDLGRDQLSRLLIGARFSLGASAAIVALAVAVALPLGLISGYAGGRVDNAIQRVMDALFAFPPLVLALAVRALLGPTFRNLVFAIAIVFVPSFVRLLRGQVLAVREETYIEAAQSVGAGSPRIVSRHILPNVASPLIIQVALSIGFALLALAGLSFLGFGIPPPAPTWGGMLRRSFAFVLDAPYQVLIAGGAITVTVLAYNLVGDGLRDALGREQPVVSTFGGRLRARATSRRRDDAADTSRPLLEVSDLSIEFAHGDGWLRVVDGVGFSVDAGETLGLVGESGCGKTVSSLAVVGLLPQRTARVAGSVRLQGRELVGLSPAAMRAVRGRDVSMIFQDPTASLNPAFTVGDQITEAVRSHRSISRRAAWVEAVELLDRVGIPSPGARAKSYPHELSGGMRQRAMIAMALSSDPQVLVADEPTTALDVTIQAQILELISSLQDEMDMAVLFVTHDLGVVTEICDRVAVMYAGEIVETAGVDGLFERPTHPYTEALIRSLPQAVGPGERLASIPGQVPRPGAWPGGCHFEPRCAYADERCGSPVDLVPNGERAVRCVRSAELELRGTRR